MILYKLIYTIFQISVRKIMISQNCWVPCEPCVPVNCSCVPMCIEVCTANISCHCHQKEDSHHQFAKILEKQLKINTRRHTQQNDVLSRQVAQLKMIARKYQARQKLDKQQIRDLEVQIDLLKKRSIVKQEIIKNKVQIKEVKIKQDNPQLKEQIKILLQRNRELSEQLLKAKSQLSLIQNETNDLKYQLQKYKGLQRKLKRQIQILKDQIQDESKKSKKLNEKINQLSYQISIFSPKVIYEQKEKIVQKIVTKIQTVYVQKPIERLVCVEIPKVIKQFIQPERTVVNRIIQCQDKCECKEKKTCKQVQQQDCECSQKIKDLCQIVQQYKDQRSRLVDLIDDQKRQLNDLQDQVISKNRKNAHAHHGPTHIDVKVTKKKKQDDIQYYMHCLDDEDQRPQLKKNTYKTSTRK